MTKILNPKECLRRFIEGKIQHNRELYEAGSKNLYFEWEDFGNDILNQEELLDSYVRECSELRMANKSLKRDIERLNKSKNNIEYDNIINNKDDLISQLESLKEEDIYMLKNSNHDEVFQRDLHALRIVINMLRGSK